jgi:hypothetical protein
LISSAPIKPVHLTPLPTFKNLQQSAGTCSDPQRKSKMKNQSQSLQPPGPSLQTNPTEAITNLQKYSVTFSNLQESSARPQAGKNETKPRRPNRIVPFSTRRQVPSILHPKSPTQTPLPQTALCHRFDPG